MSRRLLVARLGLLFETSSSALAKFRNKFGAPLDAEEDRTSRIAVMMARPAFGALKLQTNVTMPFIGTVKCGLDVIGWYTALCYNVI